MGYTLSELKRQCRLVDKLAKVAARMSYEADLVESDADSTYDDIIRVKYAKRRTYRDYAVARRRVFRNIGESLREHGAASSKRKVSHIFGALLSRPARGRVGRGPPSASAPPSGP